MHTVPFEGSVGLVNMLTATRLQRKGFELTFVLYGPGVLMASAARGYPAVGSEGFPGNLSMNRQLQVLMVRLLPRVFLVIYLMSVMLRLLHF